MHKDTTLKKIQKHLDDTCKSNGWNNNSVYEVFLLFSEEIGELAKEIRRHTGLKSGKLPESKENLSNEFADVFNYFLELANRFEVDLTEAYFNKHKINESRKWEE